MEIEQTRKNLMQAQKVYFKYFSSQKMACTKVTMRRRVEAGAKTIPNSQPPTVEAQKVPQIWKDH